MTDHKRLIGLRVDVDTLRGTSLGVPALLETMKEHGITASFFFSVGPDNMGRHLFRLFNPVFALKMLRTKAVGLYGWDILFKGTLGPGPNIGKKCRDIMAKTIASGHEVGLHAWDHHRWQRNAHLWDDEQVRNEVMQGLDFLNELTPPASPISSSAAPGWRCTETIAAAKDSLPLTYHSDCRGTDIFFPVVNGKRLAKPQIPVTLPTYDEALGRDGVTHDNFNTWLMRQLLPDALNVLTIHAEAEGLLCRELFKEFISLAFKEGWSFCTLHDLLKQAQKQDAIGQGRIVPKTIPGRQGWVACQEKLS